MRTWISILFVLLFSFLLSNLFADENLAYPTGTTFPKPAKRFGSCVLIINELGFGVRQTSHKQFLELKLRCPSQRVRLTDLTLKGYLALVFREDPQCRLTKAMDLSAGTLDDISGGPKRYFVLGESGVDPRLRDITAIRNHHTEHSYFNVTTGVPHAVALIYTGSLSATELLKLNEFIQLLRLGEIELTGQLLTLVQKSLQDVVFYTVGESGVQWRRPDILWDSFRHIAGDVSLVAIRLTNPNKSFSRCTSSNQPFRPFSFKITTATPKQPNLCEPDVSFVTTGNMLSTPQKERLVFPYSFARTTLTHQVVQLVSNLDIFIRKAKTDPSLLNGSVAQVLARALNLNVDTVHALMKRHSSGNIATPNKIRLRVGYVVGKFDSFDHDMIRGIITGFYYRNETPLLLEIYKKFVTQWKENKQLAYRLQHKRSQTSGLVDLPPPPEDCTVCSVYTFRKVLRMLGYKYGTIDKRAAVLQRPEIVSWRARFLKALEANLKSANPLGVVYTDETWVDPHGRLGKGWIRRKYVSNEEKKTFTYKNNKISRGPRIIVLSAVTINGILNAVTEIYTVKKGKASEDYHDNVDGPTFEKWFEKLLSTLDRPHIIVVDNAPYHSQSTAPTSKTKKADLYKWLADEKKKDPSLPISLPPNMKDILRAELYAQVQECKKVKNYYKIDAMARAANHTLLRLPPYNCDLNPIELVWKDVKHSIKADNREQNLAVVQELCKQIMSNYDLQNVKSHFGHVSRLGEEYRKQDGVIDSREINQIIINTNDDDSDDDDEENYGGFSSVHDNFIEVDDDDQNGAGQTSNQPTCWRRLDMSDGLE